MSAPGHAWLQPDLLRSLRDQLGTPVFIYSEDRLLGNVERVLAAAERSGIRERLELYIPFFPNANPHLFEPLRDIDGLGVLVQLPSEHRLLCDHGFERFIVSPGHVSDAEIDYWAATGAPTFLASLDEVGVALRAGMASVHVRIDSLDSGKPGIKVGELQQLAELLAAHGRRVDGVEVYCGSGNTLDEMVRSSEQVFEVVRRWFPDAGVIDFAGGHGFDYEQWDTEAKHFDWNRYFTEIDAAARRAGMPETARFLFEPARDVLADTGALLLGVERDTIRTAVGNLLVTNGSRTLMPSAQQRERRHNVVVLDAEMRAFPEGPSVPAAIRGRTILKNDYLLPGEYAVPCAAGQGDHLLVLDTGAYCATQHMEFLSVPPAPEVLVRRNGSVELISAAGGEFDRWRHVLPETKPLAVGGDA